MDNEIDTVKGFRDYLPPESLKREKIIEIAKKYFKLYGFLPVETPILEYDSLMKSSGQENDDVVSERYHLKDRGGRELGLRYEFTFQLARIFKENPNIKLPFKRYQIGSVFRDEPTRTGRTRQFMQCDVDVIGDSSVNADSECIALTFDILNELGIKNFEIQVNNRKLLDAIIESVQIENKQNVIRELDKIEKSGIEQVKINLKDLASTNQIITLFKILEKDIEFFKKNAFSGIEELEELIETLSQYEVKTKFNPFLARGLAYYTGNIFEFKTENRTTAVAGGRYDNTVGKFSLKNIPAVGISFSIEALFGLFPNEISKLKVENYPKVEIISISQDLTSIKLAKKLRKENVSCVISFDKPAKALEYANSQNIQLVIFVGEEEVGKKKYKLRDMTSGKEVLLTEAQLIKKLK